MNDWLEEQLGSALRREPPPPGFAERVLSRSRASRGAWRWAALAAAACLALTVGVSEYRRYEGQKAKEQVMRAVRIAAGEWTKAQQKIMEVEK